MKTAFIALSVLFSSSVLANAYTGAALQYQKSDIGDNNYQQVQVAGENLDLAADDSSTSVRLFAGYKLANNLGVELGYSDFSFDAGKEVMISATQDEEWDAEFNVKQLDLQLTYFYPLTEKISLKAGAGLVHHSADFDYSYKLDNEDAADQYLAQGSDSESKIGLTASLNVSYKLWQQLDAIVGLQYSNSSIADNTAAYAGLVYHF